MEERVGDAWVDRVPDGAPTALPTESVVVDRVFVVTQAFPARPSSIPDIRESVVRYLRDAPLTRKAASGSTTPS